MVASESIESGRKSAVTVQSPRRICGNRQQGESTAAHPARGVLQARVFHRLGSGLFNHSGISICLLFTAASVPRHTKPAF
jgi:hypothetical protein